MPLRMSLEDTIQKSAEALIHLRQADDTLVQSLFAELVESAKRERSSLLVEARRAFEAEAAKKLEAERAKADQALREKLAAVRAEAGKARAAELEAAHAQADQALQEGLAVVRAEAEQTRASELQAARAKADQALQEKLAAVRAEAGKARAAELQAARAKADQVLQEKLTAVRAEAEQTRAAELQAARAKADQVQEGLAAAGEKAFERLLASVGALDQAASLGHVLDLLADGAAGEAPRVAVLVVQGTRVCGWRFVGFPKIRDALSVDLAVDESGLIGRAIREGRACSGPAGPGAPAGSLPAFAASPDHRATQAVPVRVGGRVTAVVYADEAPESSERLPTSWASAIQILARHAGHCLEVLTALRVSKFADSGQLALTEPPQVAAAERPPVAAAERPPVDDTEDAARRYARLLLSEIKLYNETAVTAGREQKDLFERLRPEIERARGLYEARVSPSLRARNLYFEQELVRTLADGDPNLLGG